MPENNEDELPVVIPIPRNYQSGINILGFNMDVRRLAEGTILAIALFIAGWEFGYWTLVIDSQVQLAQIGGTMGAVGFIIGLRGANGGPVSVYVLNWLKALGHRRIARYNPRVKYEKTIMVSLEAEARDENTDDSGAYESVYQRWIKKLSASKTIHDAEASRENHEAKMDDSNQISVFADDIGVVRNVAAETKSKGNKKGE